MSLPFTAAAWPFIAGTDSAPLQAIGVSWDGADPPPSVAVDGTPQRLDWQSAPQAALYATVLVPLTDAPRTVRLGVDHQGQRVEVDCLVEPPPRWELFLVPHSHVDIGYTEHQHILQDAHGDYIAQALDLMRATDELPPEQQFHWTCEASWTVEQFLRRHGERAQEFVARVREGRMELTALYVNMTDLFGEALLEQAVRYAVELRETYGIEVVSACNYDVNGFGWALPRVLRQAGVAYLDTAINEVRGLGVRPRPFPYRWAAPDGSEVLLWHGRSYLLGNELLLHSSASWAAPHVARFLSEVRHDGYPHCGMEVLLSGVTGDSMPPDGTVCAVVAEWNRRWRWPKLRLATVRHWFEHLEANWPRPFVRHQRAWPDWWADGNGSALYEAALARRVQARLADLAVQRRVLERRGIALHRLDPSYQAAWKHTMLFCEHTWGAYESAIAPSSTAARGQWHTKAAHAYAAAGLADAIEIEQMVAHATGGQVSARASGLTNATLQGVPSGYLASRYPPAVVVFNPLPEARTDLVRAHVPAHMSAASPPRLRDAETGELVPVLVEHYPADDVVNVHHTRIEFCATNIAAESHRVFWIEAGQDAVGALQLAPDDWIENTYFQVRLDRLSGAIASIRHKPSGRELVQQGAGYQLHQTIYEQIDAPADRNAVASWAGLGRHAPFKRSTPAAVELTRGTPRPFAQRLIVTVHGEHGLRLQSEIVLYDDVERIDIINTLDKLPTTRAEALYHAFPLASPEGQIYLGVAGGVIRPGVDQVPGTATDWHGIQDWFAVAAEEYAVVVASPDVSLVQCTGINTGRWHATLPPSNGLVMSWPLNNYWFTNFPASQGGCVTYRYSIVLQEGPFDADRAGRFAARLSHPLWGHAVRLSPDAGDGALQRSS